MSKNTHNKMIAAILIAAMVMSTLTACGKDKAAGTETDENGATSRQETLADGITVLPTEGTTTAQEPTMDDVVTANSPNVVGVSSKGYYIQNINGATYVNGILIVNKTYSLSAAFDPQGLNSEVTNAFNQMQSDASAQGLNIWIQSSYRSYYYQEGLYNMYVEQDGKAMADTYSARPGYSEHQSGLSFDLNSIDDSFTNTPEGKWVDANAHKYGFIIRFPEGKESITGYKYESWHLRYVGVDYATTMYNNNQCLEEFLGVASEYAD